MANWKIEKWDGTLAVPAYVTDTLFGTRGSDGQNNGFIPTPSQNEVDKQIVSNGKTIDLANGNQSYVTLTYNKKIQPFSFEISEATDRDEILSIYNAIIYCIENNVKTRITTHDYNTNKLASELVSGATSLICYNVISFATSGSVIIGNETITYSTRTLSSYTLSGLTRTLSVTHAKDSVVKQYITLEGHFANVSKKYIYSGKNQLYKLSIEFNRTA
jgi:hypothetical protein